MQAAVLGELEQAFRRGSPERRVAILAKIMDLFAAGANAYSPDQIEVFGDVLARLVDEIETAARAELSQRLSPRRDRTAAVAAPLRARRGDRGGPAAIVRLRGVADRTAGRMRQDPRAGPSDGDHPAQEHSGTGDRPDRRARRCARCCTALRKTRARAFPMPASAFWSTAPKATTRLPKRSANAPTCRAIISCAC